MSISSRVGLSFIPLDLIEDLPLPARDQAMVVSLAATLTAGVDLAPVELLRLASLTAAGHRFRPRSPNLPIAAYRVARRPVIPALIWIERERPAERPRPVAARDTRPLMIASAGELSGKDAWATLERVNEHLVAQLASFQDFLDRSLGHLSPEDAAFQRGVREGIEMVAISIGATIEHGTTR